MHSIGTTGLPTAEQEDVRVLASIEMLLKRWRVPAAFTGAIFPVGNHRDEGLARARRIEKLIGF